MFSTVLGVYPRQEPGVNLSLVIYKLIYLYNTYCSPSSNIRGARHLRAYKGIKGSHKGLIQYTPVIPNPLILY